MYKKCLSLLIFMSMPQLTMANTVHLFFPDKLIIMFDENEPDLEAHDHEDLSYDIKLFLLAKGPVKEADVARVEELFEESESVKTISVDQDSKNAVDLCLYSNSSYQEQDLVIIVQGGFWSAHKNELNPSPKP